MADNVLNIKNLTDFRDRLVKSKDEFTIFLTQLTNNNVIENYISLTDNIINSYSFKNSNLFFDKIYQNFILNDKLKFDTNLTGSSFIFGIFKAASLPGNEDLKSKLFLFILSFIFNNNNSNNTFNTDTGTIITSNLKLGKTKADLAESILQSKIPIEVLHSQTSSISGTKYIYILDKIQIINQISSNTAGAPSSKNLDFLNAFKSIYLELNNYISQNKLLNKNEATFFQYDKSLLFFILFEIIFNFILEIINSKVTISKSIATNTINKIKISIDKTLHSTSIPNNIKLPTKNLFYKDTKSINTLITSILYIFDNLINAIDKLIIRINSIDGQTKLLQLKSKFNNISFKKFINTQQILLYDKLKLDLNNKNASFNKPIKTLDNDLFSINFRNLCKHALQLDNLKDTRNLKKFISIGIPNGFVNKIRNTISANINSSTSTYKLFRPNSNETDIICINLYRENLKNPNIVFKPLKFYFEMSRFIHPEIFNIQNQNINNFLLSNSYVDLAAKIKFLNYYYSINNQEKSMNLNIDESIGSAYLGHENLNIINFVGNDEETAQIISDIKNNIIINHIKSFFLNYYTFIMNSIELEEDDFPIAELQDLKLNINPDIAFEFGLDILRQNSIQQNNIIRKLNSNIIDNICLSLLNVSHKSRLNQFLLSPKKFDRIFNIVFDINDFEIEYEKEPKTDPINAGLIEPLPQNQLELETITYNNNINFDRYWCNIELL